MDANALNYRIWTEAYSTCVRCGRYGLVTYVNEWRTECSDTATCQRARAAREVRAA